MHQTNACANRGNPFRFVTLSIHNWMVAHLEIECNSKGYKKLDFNSCHKLNCCPLQFILCWWGWIIALFNQSQVWLGYSYFIKVPYSVQKFYMSVHWIWLVWNRSWGQISSWPLQKSNALNNLYIQAWKLIFWIQNFVKLLHPIYLSSVHLLGQHPCILQRKRIYLFARYMQPW